MAAGIAPGCKSAAERPEPVVYDLLAGPPC